jgi:hypothetical protein
MESKAIKESEFFEKFNLETNHLDNGASFGGYMFETFGKELKYVRKLAKKSPRKVWTIIECDGIMYYTSGCHLVNRIGYFISREEVEPNIEYIVEL